MGELQTEPFQFTFNGFLKVAFQGSRDAGLILVRELDERLGLGTPSLASERLPTGFEHPVRLADLLRQSVYSRLAGYEDSTRTQPFASSGQPRCGADIDVALVRDRAADPSEESRRAEGREPGGARTGRETRADRVVLDISSESPVWSAGRECGHFDTTRCFFH